MFATAPEKSATVEGMSGQASKIAKDLNTGHLDGPSDMPGYISSDEALVCKSPLTETLQIAAFCKCEVRKR